jgi:voltage-gated potassium channel Kch
VHAEILFAGVVARALPKSPGEAAHEHFGKLTPKQTLEAIGRRRALLGVLGHDAVGRKHGLCGAIRLRLCCG